jgi:hypothetical protein
LPINHKDQYEDQHLNSRNHNNIRGLKKGKSLQMIYYRSTIGLKVELKELLNN